MNENTIIPSLENLISAAEDNLEQKVSNNDKPIPEDNLFDAKKWYLQSYPVENVKTSDTTIQNTDNDKTDAKAKNQSKKSKKIIAIIIALAVIMFSIIYLPFYFETHYIDSLNNYNGGMKDTNSMSAFELHNAIDGKLVTTRDVINRYNKPSYAQITFDEGYGFMRYDTDNEKSSVCIIFDYSGNIIRCYHYYYDY